MWVRALVRRAGVARSCRLVFPNSFPSKSSYIQYLDISHKCSIISEPYEFGNVILNPPTVMAPYTLTKNQESELIQGNNKRKKELELLLLNLCVFKQQGLDLPPVLGLSDFETMMGMSPDQVEAHLPIISKRILHRKDKKLKRSEHQGTLREKRCGLLQEQNMLWLDYLLHLNSIFTHVFKQDRMRILNAFGNKGLMFGQNLIIDCSFDSQMNESFIKKMALEIVHCISLNRRSRRPFSLHLSNLQTDGRLRYYLNKRAPGIDHDLPVMLHTASCLEICDKKELVLITNNSENCFEYNPHHTYIMSALIGKQDEHTLKRENIIKQEISHFTPFDRENRWKYRWKQLDVRKAFEGVLSQKNKICGNMLKEN